MNFTALTATVQPNLDVNYIGMDVHSDNVVVCVRRNTINSSGQLVGKTIKTKKVVIKWNWDVGAEFRISIKKLGLQGLRP